MTVVGGFTEAPSVSVEVGWAEALVREVGIAGQVWMEGHLPGPRDVGVSWIVVPKAWSLYLMLSLFFFLSP